MGSDFIVAPASRVIRLEWARLAKWAYPAVFLTLHGVIATCLPPRLDPLSTACIVAAEWAAVAACVHARRTAQDAGGFWLLLGASALVHSIAMSMDVAWEIRQIPVLNHIPAVSVLLSMLSGIPVLLAVSVQRDTRARRTARVVHASLSLAAGAVIYLQIFSFLSLTGSANAGDALHVTRLFDVMDVFLAAAGTLRWLGARDKQEHRFFGVLTLFLWTVAVCSAVHNRLLMRHDEWIWLDLLVAAPYALLVPLALGTPARAVKQRPRWLVRAVQSGSPALLAGALVGLGVFETRSHFYVGLTAALFAMAAYGTLNVLIQSRGLDAEESLQASNEALEKLVDLDGLTRISNRRAFDEALERECAATRRNRQPVSLLMLDVDRFKELNDAAGHLKGDEYLIRIAEELRRTLPRTSDFVARYGGEEFAVILSATGTHGALNVAEKLRNAVAALQLSHPGSRAGVLTVSIGVSTFDGSVPLSPELLIAAADEALYKAKRNGRNRTIFQPIDKPSAARPGGV